MLKLQQSMLDKTHLGWHRQTNPYNTYDIIRYEMLKIYLNIGHSNNKMTTN